MADSNRTEEDAAENRFSVGVYVCFFNKDYSKIMLLYRNAEKRARWGADWGNVGGMVEFGETSVQGALREIKEEVGLELSVSDLKLISVKETLNFLPHLQAVHFVYSTTMDEEARITLNAHTAKPESESYEWFEVGKLPDRMLDSKDSIMKWRELAKNGSAILHS